MIVFIRTGITHNEVKSVGDDDRRYRLCKCRRMKER